jgi:hypothetical protein
LSDSNTEECYKVEINKNPVNTNGTWKPVGEAGGERDVGPKLYKVANC